MNYYELTPRESAYNYTVELNKRILLIQNGKISRINSENKVNVDELQEKICHIDPEISLPIIKNFILLISEILSDSKKLQNKIITELKLIDTQFSFNNKKSDTEIKLEGKSELAKLVGELSFYKNSLELIEDRLELLNIENATISIKKLKWNNSLEILCDLFKVLKDMNTIEENDKNKGELSSFIFHSFKTIKGTENGSLRNVNNHLSGKLNNLDNLNKFLSDVKNAAVKMGEK
jgi:hypothetical protein